jgi:hypothetical protein
VSCALTKVSLRLFCFTVSKQKIKLVEGKQGFNVPAPSTLLLEMLN